MLAADVSPVKRFAQVASSVWFCFTTAGVIFGYAALKPVLIDSGVYSQFCDDGETYCQESDTRMNACFAIAATVTNVMALPCGSLLDWIGPKRSTLIGATIFGAGNAVFALQHVDGVIDTYLIGYVLLAIGSPLIFMSQFHLSNAFSQSGLITAALVGAFDASSLPDVVYKAIFDATGGRPSLRTFFLCYTAIPVLLVIQQLTFGPPEAYSRPVVTALDAFIVSPSDPDPATSAFSRLSYQVRDVANDEEAIEVLGVSDGVVGVMYGRSVKDQLSSSWFWAMELFLCAHMTRINWYLTTVNSQLVYYTHDAALAETLTTAFTILLPAAGLASVPFVGMLLDHRPTFDVSLVLLVGGTLFGILTLCRGVIPQLIGIALLCCLRPAFYTFVSDYTAKVFGFKTFGTVYGLAMTISGLTGLLLTPFDLFVKSHGGNYDLINIPLLILSAISCLVLAWLVRPSARITLE